MFVDGHRIGIKDTTVSTTVPNANMARLMYYLNCVNSLVDFGIPQKYRDYQNYSKNTFDDGNSILIYAHLLSPEIFVIKNIMIPVKNLDKDNKFFEITDSHIAIAAAREFIIGGKKVHTMKIMAFKIEWLERNYSVPMQFFAKRMSAILNGTVESMRPRAKPLPPPQHIQRPQTAHIVIKEDDSSACLIC